MHRNNRAMAGMLPILILIFSVAGAFAQGGPVEVTGEYRVRIGWTEYAAGSTGSQEIAGQNLALNAYAALSPEMDLFVRLETDWNYGLRTPAGPPGGGFTNSVWAAYRDNPGKYFNLAYLAVTDALGSGVDLTLGRQFINVGHNLVLADEVDGCSLTRYFFEQVKLRFFAFDKHEYFDTAVPENPAAATKQVLGQDWKLVSESGLNVLGLTFSVDVGDHAVTGYLIRDSWAHFDPYTRLGVVPAGEAPAADCWYTGGTVDGYLTSQLQYLFEFCSFDPDLPEVEPADMIFFGFDWFATETTSLLAAYGRGEERFVPNLIGANHFFQGFGGRRTSAGTGLYRGWNHLLGTGSLAGIKDYLLKLTCVLDDHTSCFLQCELADDYDSSGRGLTGTQQDYRLYTVGFSRSFRETVLGCIEYRQLRYQSGTIDNLPDGGGWDQLNLEVSYSF